MDSCQDETQCTLVSSRGILKSCAIHSSQPISSIRQLIAYDFSKMKSGDTLYICNSAIPFFVNHVFPICPHSFILVSGDCDETCPAELFISHEHFLEFIENPKVLRWFSQNCVEKHPKLVQIPIGLDYHTMQKGDHAWGPQTTALVQERILKMIAEKAEPFFKRKVMAYSNYHFSMQTKFAYDRRDAYNLVPDKCVFYEPESTLRMRSWKTQSEYAFVISPHGNGLDCHRTWEALCLGCIPIVRTSALDSLYEDLPVLIVQHWSDVSFDYMSQAITVFKVKHEMGLFDYRRLTLDYWMQKISAVTV
jgi:hypothetical protein